MKIASVEMAFSGFLAYQFETLLEIYNESVEDWGGDFFPYLWMADVARAVRAKRIPERELKSLLSVLDREFGSGIDDARNLIGVSFIENLPTPSENGIELVKGFSALEKQYKIVFG